jgi:hypothetical protein
MPANIHTALMIGALDADGHRSRWQTIEVGGSFPCPVWSPDSNPIAFAVPTQAMGGLVPVP